MESAAIRRKLEKLPLALCAAGGNVRIVARFHRGVLVYARATAFRVPATGAGRVRFVRDLDEDLLEEIAVDLGIDLGRTELVAEYKHGTDLHWFDISWTEGSELVDDLAQSARMIR